MVGRRTALAEFFLMAGLAAYLKYRWVPPRILVFIILVSGALWINAIGDYRSELTQNERLSAPILSIDYIGNMKQAFTNAPDINNAVYAIDAVDRDFSLNFGLGLYDTIIFRYVPGQLIGYDVKKGLQSQFELDYDLSYNFHTGTTSTGMGWAFQTFWYFGVLWFFIIGLLMSRWFLAATRGGIVAAMILILTYYQSLAAFSFGPAGFFLRLIFLCFSLFPVLLFAKLPENAIQRFHAHRRLLDRKRFRDIALRIAVIFYSLGPYHVARLGSAAARCDLLAIEVAGRSVNYDWNPIGQVTFARQTLFPSDRHGARNSRALFDRILSTLRAHNSEVVAIPGWSGRHAAAAMRAAIDLGAAIVVMSDSQLHDFRRFAPLEWIKRRYVAQCQAGLVAGTTPPGLFGAARHVAGTDLLGL